MKAILLVAILSLTGCANLVETVAEKALDAYISSQDHGTGNLYKGVQKCVVDKTCQKQKQQDKR